MKPLHELDALCARHVAKLTWNHTGYSNFSEGEGGTVIVTDFIVCREPPPYTTDPAAVLGLLEKEPFDVSRLENEYTVNIYRVVKPHPDESKAWQVDFSGTAPTFALAGTLALLKAEGVETE